TATQEPVAANDVAAVASSGGAPVLRYLAPEGVTVEYDEFGQAVPLASGENFIAREGAPKSESLTFTLEADASVEYKAVMKQGDAIAFRWSTDGGQAYYDFHAHDDAFGPEFFTRYEEGEGTERSGSIVAGYDGQHGWFWLNLEGEPTTITLDVSGFFDEVIEIDLGGY
ncbi:MAG: hypothetical protein OEM25_05315, partial [Gammaproteobacteria bacterium]|nr:hypothetical protein [Gammaproteobacteria bacterium]